MLTRRSLPRWRCRRRRATPLRPPQPLVLCGLPSLCLTARAAGVDLWWLERREPVRGLADARDQSDVVPVTCTRSPTEPAGGAAARGGERRVHAPDGGRRGGGSSSTAGRPGYTATRWARDVKPDWPRSPSSHTLASAANVLFGYWSHDIGGLRADRRRAAHAVGAWCALARLPGARSDRPTEAVRLARRTTLRRCATRRGLEILPHL